MVVWLFRPYDAFQGMRIGTEEDRLSRATAYPDLTDAFPLEEILTEDEIDRPFVPLRSNGEVVGG